jgi:hypothetical protein
VPVGQLPIGLAATQALRLNVTCLATSERPVAPCPATLRFVDDAGLPVAVDASPDPGAPCHVVLRYSPFETATSPPASPIAERDLPVLGHVAPPWWS